MIETIPALLSRRGTGACPSSGTATGVGEAFCTSGTSPTALARLEREPARVHLVGAGQVGQAFLRLLPRTSCRLVGITDSTATLHSRDGLQACALADHKAAGRSLRELPDSESLPVDLALDLVDADLIVDATPSGVDPHAATRRNLRVLRRGARLVLAAKDTLCLAAAELLSAASRDRVGVNAALGGTGRNFLADLAELRRDCTEIILVGNASTTAVIETVERGGSIEAGIRRAQLDGVLETDPELDLDGTDAASKLVAVASACWAVSRSAPRLHDVRREHLRGLDAATLRARYRAGCTTRLVARARPDGTLRVRYEALPMGAVLAVPGDRVAYTFSLADGRTRAYIGQGIGPRGTALALLEDVEALLAPIARPQIGRAS